MAQTARGPTTQLKIGRSVQPVARLSQWRRSCPSRTPIVRGLFPAPTQAGGGATLGGALAVNPNAGPFHHRWERLVLIEAAGRAKLVNPGATGQKGKCTDCGKTHCELFEVHRCLCCTALALRSLSHSHRGAYEAWVIECITRWQRWCETIL
jgi:hypothetical protein